MHSQKKIFFTFSSIQVTVISVFCLGSVFLFSNHSAFAAGDKDQVNCSDLSLKNYQIKGQVLTRPSHLSAKEFQVCFEKNQSRDAWSVTKNQWSELDEQNFKKFIVQLGTAVENKMCDSVDSCLISPTINNQWSDFDINFIHYSDCADFPIYLRSYFAFKNNLPMVIGSGLEEAPLTPEQLEKRNKKLAKLDLDRQTILNNPNLTEEKRQKQLDANDKERKSEFDTRYSRNGNLFRSTRIFGFNSDLKITGNYSVRSFLEATKLIQNQVSSGTYRINYTPGMKNQPMFYSPVISRNSVQVGTVLYNPLGHLSIIYKITDKGEAYFIDAHPDNSVSYNKFSPDFVQSLQTHAGGFKNWRPFILQNGKVNYVADEKLSDVSQEQYTGHGTGLNLKGESKKVFEFIGSDRTYLTNDIYHWTECRLSRAGTFESCRMDPVKHFTDNLNSLCMGYKNRVSDVMKAIENGIDQKPHPSVLPINIFGAEGEWEAYSTPGRDLRLKQKVLYIMDSVQKYFGNLADRNLKFNGSAADLKEELLKAYAKVDHDCVVNINSPTEGKTISLGLSGLGQRLEFLSFDPYLCLANRWGAMIPEESAGCMMTSDKKEWVKALINLQVKTERNPEDKHGGDLNANLEKSKNVQINSSKYDLKNFLKNL